MTDPSGQPPDPTDDPSSTQSVRTDVAIVTVPSGHPSGPTEDPPSQQSVRTDVAIVTDPSGHPSGPTEDPPSQQSVRTDVAIVTDPSGDPSGPTEDPPNQQSVRTDAATVTDPPAQPRGSIDAEINDRTDAAVKEVDRMTVILGVSALLASFLGIGLSAFLRFDRTSDVLTALSSVAHRVPLDRGQDDAFERFVAAELRDAHGAQNHSPDAIAHEETVRAVGREVRRIVRSGRCAVRDTGRPSDVRRAGRVRSAHAKRSENCFKMFRDESRSEVTDMSVAVAGVQAFLLFLFPALYLAQALSFRRSVIASLKRGAGCEPSWPSFDEEIAFRRQQRFLAEESRSRIWRRLGFALMVGLGSTYVFAPTGILSSIIGEWSRANASIGSISYPYWFTGLRNAPPFMAGFAGFLLYSVTVFVQRFAAQDLSSRVFVSLFNRGVTVGILSLALAAITDGDTISRAIAFTAGVFPQTGIQLFARLAKANVGAFADEAGFREIPEIDFVKEGTLRELGIQNLHDLATTDVRSVLESIGMNPRVLLRGIDRALLIHRFGADAVALLAKIPVHTATGLVIYLRGPAVSVATADKPPRGLDLDARWPEQVATSKVTTAAGAMEVRDLEQQVLLLGVDPGVRTILAFKEKYGAL